MGKSLDLNSLEFGHFLFQSLVGWGNGRECWFFTVYMLRLEGLVTLVARTQW